MKDFIDSLTHFKNQEWDKVMDSKEGRQNVLIPQ